MSHSLMTVPGTQELLSMIEKRLPPDVVDLDCSMRVGDESKYVTVNFGTKFKTIEILHITDVQFGHIMCNVPRFRIYRDWLLAKPNRFTVWGGDMIDAAHALSVASPYTNPVEPQQRSTSSCARRCRCGTGSSGTSAATTSAGERRPSETSGI